MVLYHMLLASCLLSSVIMGYLICFVLSFFSFVMFFIFYVFFFFQAEDGIRDWSVTGVQTCALPIFKMLDGWMATLRPLYLQLHTWTKYNLAEKYHQPVPKKIPAHWINNRWTQEWEGLDRKSVV